MATPPKKPAARKPAAKSGSTGSTRRTPARNKDGSFKKRGEDNSHWSTAVIVGGVAAAGAIATAALFALRGSALLDQIEARLLGDDEDDAEGGAYQADGTDSSDSYNARIADEGTIPA